LQKEHEYSLFDETETWRKSGFKFTTKTILMNPMMSGTSLDKFSKKEDSSG